MKSTARMVWRQGIVSKKRYVMRYANCWNAMRGRWPIFGASGFRERGVKRYSAATLPPLISTIWMGVREST